MKNKRLEREIKAWGRKNKIKARGAVSAFAQKVGYQSYRSLHNVINGNRPASAEKQHVIAQELESTVDFLFGHLYSRRIAKGG